MSTPLGESFPQQDTVQPGSVLEVMLPPAPIVWQVQLRVCLNGPNHTVVPTSGGGIMSASHVGQPGLIDALIDAYTQTSICGRCLPNGERAP